MSRLTYLLSLTPLETWRIARHRLPGLKGGPAWTAAELLSSSKHGRGIRFAELLLRQEAVLTRAIGWPPLDFKGRHVVEVGCGPLAGYGPLAIFRGAASFASAEPEWDAGLFAAPLITEKYLRLFHADLVGLYGPRMDFPAFLDALRTRMVIHRTGFEAAPIEGPVDVVVSQSVLEHVFPLEATVAKLAAIQGPQTRFLHLVDFGNHYPTENPFQGLYEQPPADYIARRGNAINLLRASDILSTFHKNKIPATLVSTRTLDITVSQNLHPWWRERYNLNTLGIQLGLVASH